jgi:hypothetical protein
MPTPTRRSGPLAALVALAALLSACGDDAAAPIAANTPASDPPLAAGVDSGPPPAYVETPSGAEWMAYGSYCWGGTCADVVPPEMREDIPTLAVREGDRITFHLDFDPSELTLSFEDGEAIPVPTEREVSWPVTRGGVLNLFAREGNPGGDVAYVLRLSLQEH